MRFAAYVRISSEDQVGNYSIIAQQRAIENWVHARQGTVVKVYVDEAESGTTFDRPAFLEMRRAAQKQEFNAIVVFKFDRFARNYTESLAVKSLLRHEYGIKVFSVLETTDDNDSDASMVMESVMESIADHYTHNLSIDTAKGKRERARQGYHNNRPPFGMDKTKEGILYPNEAELKGLLMAFELYSTGDYSDNQIAKFLNDADHRSKTGSRFSTDTVRDILQNRTYLGYIKYQPYQRNPDGSRSYKADIEWYEGKHDGIIPQELFDKCQEIRYEKAPHHHHHPKHRVFLLRNIIFCAECCSNVPSDLVDSNFGRMRPQATTVYRCRAHDFGVECSQIPIPSEVADRQVINFLKSLQIPPEQREMMIRSIAQILGDKIVDKRMAEITNIVKQMDFRWDNNLIANTEDFLKKRRTLQQEIESLKPLQDNTLERAAEIVKNFGRYWDSLGDNYKLQEEIIQLLVVSVWVKSSQVVALQLRPNYHINVTI